jgi:chromosome segregation ATPase
MIRLINTIINVYFTVDRFTKLIFNFQKPIMDFTNNDSLKHLVAENESLKERLNEYQYTIIVKEKEILELRLQLARDNEIKSHLDNQAMELELLQSYIVDIDHQTAESDSSQIHLHQQANDPIHQLQDLKQQYAYLQTQLTELQTRLQELTNRNLLLQQQTNTIAELESFLADAEQERDEWKALANLKE